jgi:hypothetical protein
MVAYPVGTDLFHADRLTDGRTDVMKLIAVFCNFAKAPNDVMLRRLMVFEAIHQRRAIILFGEPYHVLCWLSFVDHASLSVLVVVYEISLCI